MTAVCAALGGAVLLLLVELGVWCVLRRIGARSWRGPESARSTFATVLRTMSLASGFESVVLYLRIEPQSQTRVETLVIGFEEVARALDKGDVLGRTDAPPPLHVPLVDESYDGRA